MISHPRLSRHWPRFCLNVTNTWGRWRLTDAEVETGESYEFQYHRETYTDWVGSDILR